MDDMRNHPRLHRRGSTYYFRAKIPADLINAYGCREIKFSLKTTDKKIAALRVHIESEKLNREFAQKREKLGLNLFAKAHVVPLSDDIIGYLCQRAETTFLDGDNVHRERISLTHEETPDQRLSRIKATVEILQAGYINNDFDSSNELLEYVLILVGCEVSEDDLRYLELRREFHSAALQAYQHLLSRALGTPIATPKPPNPLPELLPPSSKPGLTRLLERWETAQKQRNPATVSDYKRVAEKFVCFAGKKREQDYTRQDVVSYRNHLLHTEDLTPKTTSKHLGILTSLFNIGLDDEEIKLTQNPAARVSCGGSKVTKEPRIPFELSDIHKIFSSPVFTKEDRPVGGGGEAAYWLPILAFFTGARLEEIGQVCTQDVKPHESLEYWYFEISDAGDKTLKTETSRRRVPLHPELIKLGFLAYCEHITKAGGGLLFPDLRADSKGNLTGNFSKWFGRYLRKTIKIEDSRKVFHSFRHTFKQACKEADIPEIVSDALTGHASTSVGRSYGGKQYPLKPLWEAMQKLELHTGLKTKAASA